METKPRLNMGIIIGIGINILVTMMFASENANMGLFLLILIVPLFLSLYGIIMVLNEKLKWGYRLIIIGSAFFVPIGLIAILGVKTAQKKNDDSDFEKRKEELSAE